MMKRLSLLTISVLIAGTAARSLRHRPHGLGAMPQVRTAFSSG
jgi:hypothetical protein